MTDFSSLGLNPQLCRACDALGYVKPSPIQEKAIPLMLQGHDVLGIAQTGTGKTAAAELEERLAKQMRSAEEAARAWVGNS